LDVRWNDHSLLVRKNRGGAENGGEVEVEYEPKNKRIDCRKKEAFNTAPRGPLKDILIVIKTWNAAKCELVKGKV
jgi:hypothetical protein